MLLGNYVVNLDNLDLLKSKIIALYMFRIDSLDSINENTRTAY